ncbi:unnamed protein product [Protopolystoma xenopodis]|uniref:Uncharacterized protein n=1 Tax=Protopolystoma xenopodis TaxID=117903 RepID=A0A448WQF2_9PLAT|nr:unnamed protein product [Protopolystoma xenopodis]
MADLEEIRIQMRLAQENSVKNKSALRGSKAEQGVRFGKLWQHRRLSSGTGHIPKAKLVQPSIKLPLRASYQLPHGLVFTSKQDILSLHTASGLSWRTCALLPSSTGMVIPPAFDLADNVVVIPNSQGLVGYEEIVR